MAAAWIVEPVDILEDTVSAFGDIPALRNR